ncbi:MAG: glycoside hydrolase family 130 protein [Actinomycetota bacterium]
MRPSRSLVGDSLMPTVPITRSPVHLLPDPRRLITKLYLPVDVSPAEGRARVERLVNRILALTSDEAKDTLDGLRMASGEQYPDFDEVLLQGFSEVAHLVPDAAGLSADWQRVIGAYFMHRYSLEGAALTNPSIVPAPDQTGVPDGSLRVIVSVRAVGEGHISSIEFRTGMVGPGGDIELAAAGSPVTGARQLPTFDKAVFTAKLTEMGVADDLVAQAVGRLEDRFTMAHLDEALADLERRVASSSSVQHAAQGMHWLASSNYQVTFPPESELSQRVLFPAGPSESQGMEDARLVRFAEQDGSVVYYATYTAFDGFGILPQLIETTDFEDFRISTLNGGAARNKGMAVFPRRVAGRYAALGRCDGESNYIMLSDNPRFWHDAEQIQVPTRPWELMQIGNAGAPIETEAGWLVVTHGVGPMRRYALGAILLDIDDPRRVIGQLREPLLVPNERERHGYVPNVVYSCGSLIHGDRLVIAYGASDTSTNFATAQVDALLAELT